MRNDVIKLVFVLRFCKEELAQVILEFLNSRMAKFPTLFPEQSFLAIVAENTPVDGGDDGSDLNEVRVSMFIEDKPTLTRIFIDKMTSELETFGKDVIKRLGNPATDSAYVYDVPSSEDSAKTAVKLTKDKLEAEKKQHIEKALSSLPPQVQDLVREAKAHGLDVAILTL